MTKKEKVYRRLALWLSLAGGLVFIAFGFICYVDALNNPLDDIGMSGKHSGEMYGGFIMGLGLVEILGGLLSGRWPPLK